MIISSMHSASIALFLYSATTMGATGWLCEEESSQRRGNTISACGIGVGRDENLARLMAFDNAKVEFSKVCGASDDCKGHRISVEPARTACDRDGKNYKCYRLIIFTIGSLAERAIKPLATTLSAPKHAPQKSPDVSEVTLQDTPDSFEPFTYEQIESLPKAKKGMTKKDVLKMFGSPKTVGEWGNSKKVFFYNGKMCEHPEQGCAVFFDDKGHLHSVSDFHFRYTEDLK